MRIMLGIYTPPPLSGGTLLLDATAFLGSCKSTTNEHGFEGLTAPIRRALVDSFRLYDAGILYVGLVADGQIVWEGRLEDPTLAAGESGSGLVAQALGSWRALTDVPSYTAFWSKSSVSDFRPLTLDDLAGVIPDRFTFDTQNRIYIAPNNNSTQGIAAGDAMIGYLTPDGNARGIIGAQFAWELTVPEINWRAIFQTRNTDFSGIANPWAFTSAGAGTTARATHVTFASAQTV